MIRYLAIATGNPGKAGEIINIIEADGGLPGGIRVVTLANLLGYMPEVDENGTTLEENARIKAFSAMQALAGHESGVAGETIVAADDTGLFVACLGGRPGVKSARYAGRAGINSVPTPKPTSTQTSISTSTLSLTQTTTSMPASTLTSTPTPTPTPKPSLSQLLLEEVGSAADRRAEFRCAIAIGYPGHRSPTIVKGVCRGEINRSPKGDNGFGYDPIFYLPQLGCTMAELTAEEKNKISHRGIAVRQMAADIRLYINNLLTNTYL